MVDRYTEPELKEYEGRMYEAYPLTWVVKEIGSSVPSIKRWEYQGLIPETIFGGSHRFYTKSQINLLKKVKAMLKKYAGKGGQLDKQKEQMRGYLQRNWIK